MQTPLLLNRIPTTEEVLQSTDNPQEQSELLCDRNWSIFFKISIAINSFTVFLITLNTFLNVIEGKPISSSSGWRVLLYIVVTVGILSYTNSYMTSLFAISEAIDKAEAETEAEAESANQVGEE